jgi:hypothetical protein
MVSSNKGMMISWREQQMGMVMSSLIIFINLQSCDSGCYFSCLEVVSSCRTSVDFVLFDALCNTSSVPPFAFFTLTVSFLLLSLWFFCSGWRRWWWRREVLLLEWKLPPLCFIVFVSVLGSFAFPGSVSHHSFLLTPCIFVFSFVPPCSPFIFFLFVPPCFLFLSSSLLPLFPSCTVFALFLLFDPPPYSFFFLFCFYLKKPSL